MKYAEYAEYDDKYAEYEHCDVAVSHCNVFRVNMLNMEYDHDIQNMLFNMQNMQ